MKHSSIKRWADAAIFFSPYGVSTFSLLKPPDRANELLIIVPAKIVYYVPKMSSRSDARFSSCTPNIVSVFVSVAIDVIFVSGVFRTIVVIFFPSTK